MQYSIDSIRDGIAALTGDDGSLRHLPAEALPCTARAGDMIELLPDGSFQLLPTLTHRRAARAMAFFRKFGREQ